MLKRLMTAAGLIMLGLGLLLGMVIRVIEPGLLLSLFAYTCLFCGMLLGLSAIIQLLQNSKEQSGIR